MIHYIVALAGSKEIAKKKEAAAILFYSDRLNMLVDIKGDDRDYDFRSIDSQIPLPVVLEKKGTKYLVSAKTGSLVLVS